MTKHTFGLHAALLASVAFLAAAPHLSAQTTFNACRIPDVGAIYMIGVAGAPTACIEPTHVEFSWTEGAADGSIGTAQLADGSVTAAKLATLPHLVLTQGESVYETINPGQSYTFEMYCAPGETAIGVTMNRQGVNEIHDIDSRPWEDAGRSGWQHYFFVTGTFGGSIYTSYVLCASIATS